MVIKFNEQLPSQSHLSQTRADHGKKGAVRGESEVKYMKSRWSILTVLIVQGTDITVDKPHLSHAYTCA